MKKPILYFVLLLSTNFLFAQGSITFNPDVPSVTNGIVDFSFDLVGGGAAYDLSVEVSFNNGTDWNNINASYITGQLENVTPTAGISLEWDALSSFPGQVTSNALLRVTARHVCGTDFTFTYRGSEVTYGTILIDYGGTVGERCWLDRNLGATRPAESSDDHLAYGDLFQWGRLDDGHQDRASSTTPGPVNQDVPGHSDFITNSSSPWDWRLPQNNSLWQGEDGINNPCPPGWRVPTETELNAERQSWGSNNSAGAYISTLKWPVGGFRFINGTLSNVGSNGVVWSSSVSGTVASYLFFSSGNANMVSSSRALGMSVRCVRDN